MGWSPTQNCLFLFSLVKAPAQLNNRVTGLRMQVNKLKIVKRNPHRQCYNFCSIRHCFFDFLLCTQHVLSLVWRNSELDKRNTKGWNQSYLLKITNTFSAFEAKTEVLIIRLSSRDNRQDHHPPPVRKVLENFPDSQHAQSYNLQKFHFCCIPLRKISSKGVGGCIGNIYSLDDRRMDLHFNKPDQ